jgi:indoleamine 2,3-dioxygenase
MEARPLKHATISPSPGLPARLPAWLQPQQLYGATGAQSSIAHAFDASLGIQHDACSWLRAYLLDMRRHMPPAHRAFIAGLEAGPSLRQAAEAHPGSLKVGGWLPVVALHWQHSTLVCFLACRHRSAWQYSEALPCCPVPTCLPPPRFLVCKQAAYNECVHELERFRSQHKAFAFNYISKHSRKAAAGAAAAAETGTGGSDFMPALAGYRDTTSQHRLP